MHRRNFIAASAAAVAAPALGFMSSARAAESGVTDTEIVLGHTGILSGPLGAPAKAVVAGAPSGPLRKIGRAHV